MADPLIDGDALADDLHTVLLLGDVTSRHLADAAIAYLRTVLTPEALDRSAMVYGSIPDFVYLHRAIFGDTE